MRSCERVLDGHDQDEILLEKGRQREITSSRWKVENCEVDLSCCKLDIEPGACQLDEDQMKVGVTLGDSSQQLGHEPSRGRTDDPDTDGSGNIAGQREHVGEHRVELDLNST